MSNRLAQELSPYLQQHAHNPVDWYPWGEEALEKARLEEKPILLSIGYSACHWCHVMEHESFDDPQIAALMNELFVSIKVDREERPDLDKVYQLAVQLMTRRAGGWPLTVFLTPSLKPFYGGTYFPPEERHGMPGFPTVLASVARTFSENRENVDAVGGEVVDAIASLQHQKGGVQLEPDFILDAARKIELNFDDRYGGFGDAPKFPSTMSLDVMLRAYGRGAPEQTLSRVRQAVDAMIAGGIHDQLGGGFHRYSTDARWLVPHFEKMLYDNALLVRLLVDLWRVTKEDVYRDTATRALEYVEREMVSEAGAFFSTQDADSEGKEGTFFVWTPSQLEQVLGADDARVAALFFGVDEAGNFEEGTTVLHQTRTVEALATSLDAPAQEVSRRLEHSRRELFRAREERPKPFRDEKIIASWNGLMIGAAAEAGAAFGDDRWIRMASRALDFIEEHLWTGGELLRIHKEGRSQTAGFLVDYVEVANAAFDLYEATFETDRLRFAQRLLDQAVERFWEAGKGTFYFAADDPAVIVRTEDTFDHAVPSGTASAARALLRAESFFGDGRYQQVVEAMLERLAAQAMSNPAAHGHLLGAIDHWLNGSSQIVIAGAHDDRATDALADAVRTEAVLNRSLFLAEDGDASITAGASTLLPSRPKKDGQATAYLCRDRACSPPVTDADALVELITTG